MLHLDRGRVLAHRATVQDLATPVRDAASCRLLGLGIQNTPAGSGPTGLAARTGQPAQAVTALLGEGGPLAVVMASRGAPHVVARTELPLLRAALAPLDDAEAAEVDEVAQAMRRIVSGTAISRPALSGALNGEVDDALRMWCQRCGSRHVREDLFRKASLHAGLELDPTASPATFRPSGVDLPATPEVARARAELARRYVHLTGVARPADLAAWLGSTPGQIRPIWNEIAEELTPCTVAAKRRWALTCDVASLTGAPPPGRVTLLPPFDPYLLGDRALVVPERERQRQLWRAQASPGAIVVDGEIAGTWRHRARGSRLHVTLHPFRALDPAAVEELDRQAQRVAAVRGVPAATTAIDVAHQIVGEGSLGRCESTSK